MTEELRLLAAIAVRPGVLPVLSRFDSAAGIAVTARWELNPTIRKLIEADEPFDLVVTNPNAIEDLIAVGRLGAGTQAAFGRIAMGVAARAGTRPPDIGSVTAFKAALLRARSIAYAAGGTSGAYFSHLLDRLGIADEVGPRLVAISGGQTAPAVGRGEADLGVVPVTSILAAAPETMLVGRFPAELQSYIDFAIAISADPMFPEAAKRLSDFLTSAEIDETLAAKGIERC